MTTNLDDVRHLHDEVDRAVSELTVIHGDRLQCRRGCSDCCVDDLTIFDVEAERIRSAYPDLLRTGRPHPAGACAFLDAEGACRIYDARPYVCRTQGVPLRWFEDHDRDGVIEYRDVCPLNEPGPALESLPEDACWTIGPTEGRLASLQDRRGDAVNRVSLRSLFPRRD